MTGSVNEQRWGRAVGRTRGVTPARIVALAIIAVTAFGLAYLRFAPDAGSIAVPAGARAGDLSLRPCSYATENGSYDADCGTLVVPENRADAGSRLIALPVTRIRARSNQPAEPIFRLEGGPGVTNLQFSAASRFADDRDVVLVGYRGVDGSSVLDCPEVELALKRSTDLLGDTSFRAYADGFRSCAERFRADGVDLAGYGLAQQVDDLEAARVALGYGRINLLSESAGTRTAMIYAWRYPQSIHRSVMIAVNPPGHYVFDPKTTDEQIGRYAARCSKDDSCRKRTDDLAASLKRTAAQVPDRWGFLPIKEANVRIASYVGFFETTPKMAPVTGPITLDAWLAAAEGDPSGFWFATLAGDFIFPTMFVWGQYAAVGVQDAWAADAYYAAGGDHGSILGNPLTDLGWGGGRLGGAWPASPDDAEYRQARTSTVETLLISGELDFSTPPQIATKELLPYLPNGHQVVLAGFGHTASFWSDQPAAGSRLINHFFESGQVDESRYRPAEVDFTPAITQTGLAKGIAGTMVGFAGLAALSLLWLARRAGRWGGFGRTTSVVLRSIYPLVPGLGGWFLGALVVMTFWPAIPLDNGLLAVVSVGVPIGLGTYWAWVRRDWPAQARTAGLVAALGGALISAWLGLNAADGPLALATTIVGATVGANLALIFLDIARDRPGRDRFAATAVDEALKTRPSRLAEH